MKNILLATFMLLSLNSFAQHCPWDCAGFLMIKTDATPAEMSMLKAALVDSKKQLVIDTLYGTGKETIDTTNIMEWDEFEKYRKEKTKIHNWYNHDTMLSFAKGYYVVRYNYCKFDNANPQDLSIRYIGPGHGHYHFMPVAADKRIHLHDYNSLISKKEKEEILKALESKIINVSRAQWGFQ